MVKFNWSCTGGVQAYSIISVFLNVEFASFYIVRRFQVRMQIFLFLTLENMAAVGLLCSLTLIS